MDQYMISPDSKENDNTRCDYIQIQQKLLKKLKASKNKKQSGFLQPKQ